MSNVHRINDNEAKVKEALQVWSEWMEQDQTENALGYGRCVGFDSGGSVSGWDDFERKVDKNMAINVQAIYEGLKHPQQVAIDHFHLAAVWKSNRTNIEDDYAGALVAIEIGLRRRGLI
jgi:hypothetical protein